MKDSAPICAIWVPQLSSNKAEAMKTSSKHRTLKPSLCLNASASSLFLEDFTVKCVHNLGMRLMNILQMNESVHFPDQLMSWIKKYSSNIRFFIESYFKWTLHNHIKEPFMLDHPRAVERY